MCRREIIAICVCFTILLPATSGFSKVTVHKYLLRDGFFLRGIDGKLTAEDSNKSTDRFFFEFDSQVNDDRGHLEAGTRLQVLPSEALEKMAVDMNKRAGAGYRLWARVTKYKGRNFIFPTYYIPLVKTAPHQPVKVKQLTQQAGRTAKSAPDQKTKRRQPAINEANDIQVIPQEVIEKLKSKKVVRPGSLNKSPRTNKAKADNSEPQKNRKEQNRTGTGLILKRNYILADRLGYIRKHKAQASKIGEKLRFVNDAFGLGLPKVSLRLLPCEALERAEQQQSAEPEPVRFKIAGIVTEYKGSKYLLLHRAAQVYSYGNFTR